MKIACLFILLMVQCLASCHWSRPVSVADIPDLSGIREGGVQETVVQGPEVSRSSLKVMTFNIRWQGQDNDGKFHDSGFARRKPLVLDVLTHFDADIIGLQEASIEQRAALNPDLSGYGMFPLPAEAGDECIVYRLGRFDLRGAGHEVLRRNSEIAGTNIGVRDFVWVYLEDRINGKRFYVLNLHMDHRSSGRGRQLDGILIGEWIRNRKFPDPVILVGDFNGGPDQPRYLYLTGHSDYPGEDGVAVSMPMPMLDTFTVANPYAQYSGTINPGYRGEKNNSQIDYVFVPRGANVIDSKIIYYHVNGFYPSDHFPLLTEFELE